MASLEMLRALCACAYYYVRQSAVESLGHKGYHVRACSGWRLNAQIQSSAFSKLEMASAAARRKSFWTCCLQRMKNYCELLNVH